MIFQQVADLLARPPHERNKTDPGGKVLGYEDVFTKIGLCRALRIGRAGRGLRVPIHPLGGRGQADRAA